MDSSTSKTRIVDYWRQSRDLSALFVLGIIVLQFGHWLSGGAYATSSLTWFAIGTMDRMMATARLAPAPSMIRRPRLPMRRPRLAAGTA
jgi:hypothetical protein